MKILSLGQSAVIGACGCLLLVISTCTMSISYDKTKPLWTRACSLTNGLMVCGDTTSTFGTDRLSDVLKDRTLTANCRGFSTESGGIALECTP